ncbi:MAG: ester cyclase [Chloroflexi bacterium]|nr:ester cyclase [Chloroflexota bacterium]
MSTESIEFIRKLVKELDRRHEPPDEFYAPDCQVYLMGNPPIPYREYKDLSKSFFAAFPDLVHGIDELIADGDNVLLRMTVRATHKGEFMGVPATGKPVKYSGMVLWRVANGKVTEFYSVFDQLALLGATGVVELPKG